MCILDTINNPLNVENPLGVGAFGIEIPITISITNSH